MSATPYTADTFTIYGSAAAKIYAASGQLTALHSQHPAFDHALVVERGTPLHVGTEVEVEGIRCHVISRRFDQCNPAGPCWVAKVLPLPPPFLPGA